jgi:sn-glycerol 3-phosphate transport system permease protein
MMIPMSALVIPNYITMKDLGLLDTLPAIMLPYFGSAMATYFLRQSFRGIPIEYEESARLDGAGTLRVIWQIYLPNVRSAVLAFSLISFSYHWDDFFWPLIATNSDDKRILTVGLALFTQASEAGAAWQLVTAATMIVIVPVLVLFLIFQRHFITGYAHSGLK